jgi:hypothetical protein
MAAKTIDARRPRSGRSPKRHRATALVGAVLGLATVTFMGVPVPDQTGAATPFVTGTSNASAQVLSVPVELAGENVGITGALSNAGYTNLDGQSESELAASGLTAELPIPVPPQLAPLEASSTSTLVSSSKTVVGSSGTDLGNEAVAASQSSGLAATSLFGFSAGSSLVISGGQSQAAGSVIAGGTRQATSTASVGSISLLNGLVVLTGLEWSAIQQTGATPTTSSSFSLGAVKVAGVTLPVAAPSLASTFATVNAALATTGIHLTPPRQIVATNGGVTESSLSIGLDNSALGMQVLGPVISAVQPLRNVLFDDLATLSTTTGEVDLVAEIVLGILAGQGSLEVNLGGAYAATNGTTYADPFGSGGASNIGGVPDTSAGGATLHSEGTTFSGVGSTFSSPAGARAGSTTSTIPAHVSSAAPVRLTSSTSCQSTTVGGCTSESARTVALILVVGTALLALAEFARQRRKLRRLAASQSADGLDHMA